MIVSFGHQFGVPSLHIDRVFDVRALTHDVDSPEFKAREQEIADYGRAHPTENVAVGCEKGKHRSVVLANRVATTLRTSVYHRDKSAR